MTVLHSNGIHRVNVCYCDCSRASGRRAQLLNVGWYPATITDPRTCATTVVLDHFHRLNLAGNMNVLDFIAALEQHTDGTKVEETPVSFLLRHNTPY